MSGMIFMLRISFEVMALAWIIPGMWIALALLLILALFARHRPLRPAASRRRWLVESAGLILVPLVMLILGVAIWPTEQQVRSPHE